MYAWSLSLNLQQLRFICEVARHDFNISAAARELGFSQPGVSKQIRQFEEQLGVRVFERSGKHLLGLSREGREVLRRAREVLLEVEGLRRLGREWKSPDSGSLSLATTHTQARYVLPSLIQCFTRRYPQVSLHMYQGTPRQIADLAAHGTVDFAIATEAMEYFKNLVMLPCYRWNRSVIVPRGHPLARMARPGLKAVASYPLITYVFGFTGRSRLDEAFNAAGLHPNLVLTASDADVIKTYVKLGLGIGIIATMAYDPEQDAELVALDAAHLFKPSVTRIGFRKGIFLRGYMYEFIRLFAAHLERPLVERVAEAASQRERDTLLAALELPDC